MIVNQFNGTRRATGMFDSCVVKAYGLRECIDSVENIIDIGANIGFFSVTGRILCPHAQIVALEPDPKYYATLLQNVDHLRVQPVRVALGNGVAMAQCESRGGRDPMGCRYDVGGGLSLDIKSVRLGAMVEAFQLSANLFIKIDCEGGERHLLGDIEAEEIIRNSVGIGGEFHHLHGIGPSFNEFKEWLNSLVGDTHKIEFFQVYRGSIREFQAVRKIRTPAIRRPTQGRVVRFLKEARMKGLGRWKEDELAFLENHLAAHSVSIGLCEYYLP